jgi:hypothetical protein
MVASSNGFVISYIGIARPSKSTSISSFVPMADVWLAVLIQPSSYSIANSEDVRGNFVAHEG